LSRLSSSSLLLDAAVAEDLIVVVGERGHILTSRDDGRTWRQASVPTRATLTGVFLHDDTLGWAVGHDGVILRTENGGDDWTLLYSLDEEDRPLLNVLFLNETEGFAIGAYGLFLFTKDAGDTWTEGAVSEYDWHLNHISRTETGLLFIAAEAGNIFRSDDRGVSWTAMPSPYAGSFFGTLPIKKDTLLLFGLRGRVFRSEDAGSTWRETATGSESLLSGGLIRKDGAIVLIGQDGTILSSDNEGINFNLRQLPERTAFSTGIRTPEDAMLLVGEAGAQRFSE
jgi:photosystem II stability/assembly factor-like uncharacterized protein